MATSGSWDYGRTAAQIITSALENLGVLAAGGTVATADNTTALARLNYIAKQNQGQNDGSPGLKVHTRQRVALFVAKGQQTYTVGPASTDARATILYGRTTISADEAAAQTVISITSNTDTTNYPGTTVTMASADIVGIELNDGTIQWTTISGTPAATMTIGNALTGASSAGRYVWWFTARAQRLINLEAAVLRDKNLNDIQLGIFRTIQQYDIGIANKYADGAPRNVLFEPLRVNSRITLDSQPTDVTSQIILTGWYPSEDYDATSDDIAYPQESFRFLSWELTYELHAAYGVDWTPGMEKMRMEAKQSYLNLNPEVSDLYFRPNA